MSKIDDHKIEFIESSHEYFVNGEKKPCISDINKEVLKSSFKDIPDFILKKASARGDAVHRMIRYDLTDGLDPSTVDDKLKGYFESYSLYKEGKSFLPKLIEKQVYSESLDYCFTLDYFGAVDGKDSLLDWKTGSVYDEVKYRSQIGGQLHGLVEYGFCMDLIGCVQLYKNGKIGKLYEYDSVQALCDWRSVKRVYDLRISQ